MKSGFSFIFLLIFSSQLSFAQIEDEVIEDETIDNTAIINSKKNKKLKNKKSAAKIDNVFLGTTFSFSVSSQFFLDISPYGGYLIGKHVGVGLGVTYIYFADLVNGNSDHIYGGRLFVNLRPFSEIKGLKGVYAHIEGEYLNHPEYFNGALIRKFVPAVNVGIGYNTAFDKGFAFTAELLVNPLWFSRMNLGLSNVYLTPWQYRVGVYYAF